MTTAPARTQTKNNFATVAMIMALVSLVLSPFMILNVVAIVFGAVGIAQSRSLGGVGRSRAIGAVFVGIFGLACGLIALVALLSQFLANPIQASP